MSKIFLDTNILVYGIDHFDKRKNDIALKLLSRFNVSNGATISTQVVQEFFVTVTGKLKVDSIHTKEAIARLDLEIIGININTINSAIDLHDEYQVSFWDGLIIASAIEAGCDKILTEDLNHLQRILSVSIENPFK